MQSPLFMSQYTFREIEQKWQQRWEAQQLYKAENHSDKPKYYVLDMFPYPSGAGLHVGHPLGYIASDIVARYKRLTGYNVLHPMGFDSFGLPAEQYAIQTGQHPAITTEQNITRYIAQLKNIGFAYDWSREVRTSAPDFYKWTQWIFMQLFNSWYNQDTNKAESIHLLVHTFARSGNASVRAVCDEDTPVFSADEWSRFSLTRQQEILLKYRLAYLADTTVNWCPALGTVLANEEVKDGVSERGGYPVIRKEMQQWSLRITAYAERLLQSLEEIDWPEPIKEIQRNWIGKSVGAEVEFGLIPDPSPNAHQAFMEKGAHGYQTADSTKWDQLKDFGKANRQNLTETERIIWEEIRDRKLGYKFRRQHAIEGFIVDFVCIEKKLVIEIDGNIHEKQQEYDRERTEILNQKGFTVIRFTNNEVLQKLPIIVEKIKTVLDNSPLPRRGAGGEASITVFTTRPDTIFGVTFLVIAPEHELAPQLTTPEQQAAVAEYVETARNRSERDRMSDVKTVSGVFTGSYVINPVNGEQVPVWIADYVLAGYGTGAVMGVPANDERDYRFAKHFNLPIMPILTGERTDITQTDFDPKAGTIINSDFLNGLTAKEAVPAAIAKVEELGVGKGKVNYRMRDAVFSRQRYWGEPVPVYFKDGMPHLIDENDLPLLLPEIDAYLPTETGEPPLGRAKDWKYRGEYEYELSTMPGWAGSSWYFFRYMDAHNDQVFAGKDALNYWQNVDLYIGGPEHATGHLLYSRFWTKFLCDLGYVSVQEPFKKLINQGMIQGVSEKMLLMGFKSKIADGKEIVTQSNTITIPDKYSMNFGEEVKYLFYSTDVTRPDEVVERHVPIEFVENNILDIPRFIKEQPEYKKAVFICNGGYWTDGKFIEKIPGESKNFKTKPEVEKMSKRYGNVVNPDDVVEKYGADTLRLYEMFLGPLEQSKPWNTNGISGVHNFLRKLWRLFHHENGQFDVSDAQPTKEELKQLHKAIKKVQEDIDNFSFNTSVSTLMICVNELSALKCNKRAVLQDLVIILAPYAPHIAEELWSLLGNQDSVFNARYPQWQPEYLTEDSFEYPISINGKLRVKMTFSVDTTPAEIEQSVLASEQVQKWLEGKPPKKIIVVPKRIVNVVV